MKTFAQRPTWASISALALIAVLFVGCAARQEPRTTARDKTKKGAGIGAGVGAVLGAILGEGEVDEILAGAAIGAGIGAGVGAYMDRQEEKLAQIPGTTVERVAKNLLLVHFESDVLFGVDSASLDPQSRSALEEAAAVFAEYEKTGIVVQGHTDASGSEVHNQELSERRAKAVEGFLIGRGIDAERMASVGYGESSPIADNDSTAGKALNRRVDLLLKAKVR